MLLLFEQAPTLASSGERSLTFEDRVEAQRAIERVYYSHQIGATRPFEEAVPREVLERKVLTYLRQSLALERFWKSPVTAAALERELQRIASSTRFPERLEDIYDALGHDAFLIQETLARATLVDRLAHSFFASDDRIHTVTRERAERLRMLVKRGAAAGNESAHASIVQYTRRDAARSHRAADERGEDDSPEQVLRIELEPAEFTQVKAKIPARRGEIGNLQETREAFGFTVLMEDEPGAILVAHYFEPKITWDSWWQTVEHQWDETRAPAVARSDSKLSSPLSFRFHRSIDNNEVSDQAGSFSCAPNDSWNNGSLDDAHPAQRWEHVAVWTGSEMLVWGGRNNSGGIIGGARYDPLTDMWVPMAIAGAPASCCNASAVWTGTQMLVWGGRDNSLTPVDVGGRYDPTTDIWEPITSNGAPAPRYLHTAVWTGDRMVVWGGSTQPGVAGPTETGGRYDPSTDTWSPTTVANAPSARTEHTAIWTGSKMLVWGGSGGTPLAPRGANYDPALDTWSPISEVGAPSARWRHTAVWTGSRMVVWGGSPELNTGGRYDPMTDTWLPTSVVNVPPGANSHTAVWTGSRMVVWGGMGNTEFATNTGGVYNPIADTWTATNFLNAPGPRSHHTAVWTGTEMIIWGGAVVATLEVYHTGGRYNPVDDGWTPMNAPAGRWAHTAVWTGNLMVVWGGLGETGSLSSGSRYDPMTDSWSPTSSAPYARIGHTAVWTGTEMIVWGGAGTTGNKYDPLSNTWTPTSTTNAPSSRIDHTAVWTGDSMIIWGGHDGSLQMPFNTGGRYRPDIDTWFGLSLVNAPAGRLQHSGVWTGTDMIVWGGSDGEADLGDGGRYDPVADSWEPVSSVGAPSARSFHTATWATGGEMIVWGGIVDGTCPGTGARYRPSSDTWRPMSMNGAPTACSHTSVWTGDIVIVWSGGGAGGRYAPLTDTWTPMTIVGAPPARSRHTAVWTGTAMIGWGGRPPFDDPSPTSTGGMYSPGTDPSPDGDMDDVTVCGGDCDDAEASVYPTAPQLCDGRNNDCRHPGWPSLAGTNENDGDGDLMSECQGDCDDTNNSVWATPTEARNLRLLSDASTLTWNPPIVAGANTILYDSIRSPVAADFVGPAQCLESNDGNNTDALDLSVPSLGAVYYYLVRPENLCPGSLGQGPGGFDSTGFPRAGRSCP